MMTTEHEGFQIYLKEISKNRVLSRDEERDLFAELAAGDEQVRGVIIDCNLKFVIRLARKFLGRGMPLEDLVQEGNIGLLEAIARFDHTLGFRFSTYSAFWIRQAIQVAVRQKGSMVRIPVRKSRQLGFLREIIQEYQSIHGRPPNEEEVAERLKITPEAAKELSRLGAAVLSIDTVENPDAPNLLEQLVDPDAVSPEESSMEMELKAKVAAVLDFLSERERQVLHHRYGFRTGTSLSLRKVSKSMGLSQEGVRRIEQRAIDKLRRPYARQTVNGLL